MKKTLSVLPFLVFLCYCILPICSIIAWMFGYDFVLRSYLLYSMVLAAISLLATISLFVSRIVLNKINVVFSALLLPMSVINDIYYSSYINNSDKKLTIIFTLIGFDCAIAVFFKFAGPKTLKIICGFLSGLLFLFLLVISVLGVFVGIMSNNTVVKSVSSPQNTYAAEVIDNNQGATGGSTLVNVKNNNKTFDVFIGKFSKHPVCVYSGRWGEFNKIQPSWKNEHTLVIYGTEYYITD